MSLRREYKWLKIIMEEQLSVVGGFPLGMYKEELAAFAAKLQEHLDNGGQMTRVIPVAHKKGRK
jgi:hypothetical protein